MSSMAIVSSAFMCAASHVERHGKLLNSVLGPCSGAAEGKISSLLVGPFVGFHHQALLIACFWPAGRGNIGYGANVDSNHTGKAPDQESGPARACSSPWPRPSSSRPISRARPTRSWRRASSRCRKRWACRFR